MAVPRLKAATCVLFPQRAHHSRYTGAHLDEQLAGMISLMPNVGHAMLTLATFMHDRLGSAARECEVRSKTNKTTTELQSTV